MAASLLRRLTRTIEQRRVRHSDIASGRWRDGRALPSTGGQALMAPGAIGPALADPAVDA